MDEYVIMPISHLKSIPLEKNHLRQMKRERWFDCVNTVPLMNIDRKSSNFPNDHI